MSFTQAISQLFDFYLFLILIRVFMSWFPSIDWRKQPYLIIDKLASFVLTPFKNIIPPLGMIDLSPIVAMFFVRIVQVVVCDVLLSRFLV